MNCGELSRIKRRSPPSHALAALGTSIGADSAWSKVTNLDAATYATDVDASDDESETRGLFGRRRRGSRCARRCVCCCECEIAMCGTGFLDLRSISVATKTRCYAARRASTNIILRPGISPSGASFPGLKINFQNAIPLLTRTMRVEYNP